MSAAQATGRCFEHMGQFDSALEVETAPMVQAARELDALGLDALQKASLFGNVTALFAMKSGLSRRRYLALCAELWAATEQQVGLMEVPNARIVRGGEG